MATVVPYAVRRTRDHLARFDGLYHALMDGAVDEARLAEIEARDTAFQEVDPTQWRSDRVRHPGAGAAVWSVSTD
jgi:1,4-alpha-glucan branching enzyme